MRNINEVLLKKVQEPQAQVRDMADKASKKKKYQYTVSFTKEIIICTNRAIHGSRRM